MWNLNISIPKGDKIKMFYFMNWIGPFLELTVYYTFTGRIKVCLISYSDGCFAQSRPCFRWQSRLTPPHCWVASELSDRRAHTVHLAAEGRAACAASSCAWTFRSCPARLGAAFHHYLARLFWKKWCPMMQKYSISYLTKKSVTGSPVVSSHFMVCV